MGFLPHCYRMGFGAPRRSLSQRGSKRTKAKHNKLFGPGHTADQWASNMNNLAAFMEYETQYLQSTGWLISGDANDKNHR